MFNESQLGTAGNKYYARRPDHLDAGFTVFVVPDKVLYDKYPQYFSASNSLDENVEGLYELAKTKYDDQTSAQIFGLNDIDPETGLTNKEACWNLDSLENPYNPLHLFLSYHVLDRLFESTDIMVNPYGVNYYTPKNSATDRFDLADPTEWVSTLLDFTLLKIEKVYFAVDTRVEHSGDFYLNHCTGVEASDNPSGEYRKGAHVTQPENNFSINCAFYYLDDVIAYDADTRGNVMNTRIRMDMSTLWPELTNNGIRLAERTTCGGMGARKDKRPQQLLQPLRPGNHAMETSRPGVHDVHHHLAPPFRPKLPRHGGSVNGRPRRKDEVGFREFAGRHSGLGQTLPRGGVTAMAPCTPQPDVVVIGHRGNQPYLKSFREVVDRFQRAMPLERVREITAPPDHPMPRFREGPTKQTVALRTAPFAGKIVEWVIDPNIHERNPPRAQALEEATSAKHPKRGVFSLRGLCVSPKRWAEARLTIPSPAHGQGQCHGRSSTVQDSRGYSEVRGSRGAPWPKR